MRATKSGSAVGERIKQAVQHAGITLRELADKMGVSRPTIYAYVSGALRVPKARIRAIAEVTGCAPEFFEVPSNKHDSIDNYRELAIELIDGLLSNPNPEKAIAVAQQVAADLELQDGELEKAMLWQRIGNALTLSGKYLEAVPYIEQAQSWYQMTNRQVDASDCAQSLGYCYINLGQLEKAAASFEYALQHAPDQTRWKPVISLAGLAERKGNFEEAMERLNAITDEDKLGDAILAYIKANQASLSATRGLWNDALTLNLKALEYARAAGLQDQITERRIQIAKAYLHQGLIEQASLWLVRALDAARMTKDTARETLAQLVQASLQATLGDWKAARETTIQALTTATRQQYRRSEACALLQLVEIANARQDYESARDYALQALSFGEAHSYYVVTCVAQLQLARVMLELDEPVESKRLLDTLTEDSRFAMLGEPRAMSHFVRARWFASQSLFQEAVSEARKGLQIANEVGAGLLTIREHPALVEYLKKAGDTRTAEQEKGIIDQLKTKFEQQNVFVVNSHPGYEISFIPGKAKLEDKNR